MKYVILFAFSAMFFACDSGKVENEENKISDSTTTVTNESKPAEFADMKYAEIGKANLAAMTAGNVDAWMSTYADNAVYQWNDGDSLVGKAAITEYWRKRRTEVIDSIVFTNEIWLPVKVNQPQAGEQTGVWLLGWYAVNAKYKSGKNMMQWLHNVQHFNEDGKIDRVIQYIDKAVVNAAMQ